MKARLGRLPAAALGLIGLALALRLTAALADAVPLAADARDYWRHALSIGHGHGFPGSVLTHDPQPSAVRPPLYPYFLGALVAVFGDGMTAVRVVQAVLGTVSVALLGWIAYRLFGRTAGIAALALGALHPLFVYNAGALMSEVLWTPLALGVVAASLWARDAPDQRRRLVLAGVLVGLAMLTRFSGVLLLIPAWLLIAGAVPTWRARIGRAAAVAAVAVLCISPWTVRNAMVMNSFIPVALEEGLQLSGIMNDEARNSEDLPGAWIPPTLVPRYADIFRTPGLTEPEVDHLMTSRALEYLGDHPTYILEVAGWNTVRMLHFGPDRFEKASAHEQNVPRWVHETSRFYFYALALVGLAGALRVRRLPLWLWLTPLAYFAAGAVSAGLPRYRLPLDLFLIVVAAAAVMWRGGGRRSAPPAPSPSPAG